MYKVCVVHLILLMLVFNLGAAKGHEQFEMTRAEVVERIKNSIRVPVHSVPVALQQKDTLLLAVKGSAEELAQTILPDRLVAPSREALEMATGIPILIVYPDEEYYRLVLEVYLSSIKVRLAYLEKFPPLTNAQKEAIHASVIDVLEKAKASMEARLVPLGVILQEDIDAAIRRETEQLARHIRSDVFSYSLTLPLTQDDVGKLADEFDARLAQSADRIRKRIDDIGRSRLSGRQQEMMKTVTVQEVLGPLIKEVMKRTTEPERKLFDLDKVQPGLAQLGKRLSLLEAQMRRKWIDGDDESRNRKPTTAVGRNR